MKSIAEHSSDDETPAPHRAHGPRYLDESPHEYSSRTKELLRFMPPMSKNAPMEAATHRHAQLHEKAESVQDQSVDASSMAPMRRPDGGFPGDGQSIASLSSTTSSRQRRKLDLSVEQQLKDMLNKQLPAGKPHHPRPSRRHRSSSGHARDDIDRRDSEHSTDHPHVVHHEHRHVHEHYFKNAGPPSDVLESGTIQVSETSSHRISFHHERTSRGESYYMSEKSMHSREGRISSPSMRRNPTGSDQRHHR